MEHRIRHQLVSVTVALGVAATLAAPALAARPDDRAGMRGPGAVGTSIERPAAVTFFLANERATLASQGTALRPDDRAGVRGPGAISVAPVTRATSVDDGFEWSAAALGGGFVAVLGALGALLIVSGRRVQGRPT